MSGPGWGVGGSDHTEQEREEWGPGEGPDGQPHPGSRETAAWPPSVCVPDLSFFFLFFFS